MTSIGVSSPIRPCAADPGKAGIGTSDGPVRMSGSALPRNSHAPVVETE